MSDMDVKTAILKRLMFADKILYSDLHKVTENHDLFNYHLRELIARGLVVKADKYYSLTEAGRQQVSLMEEDGKYQKQIKVSMFIDLVRWRNGKPQMLLYRRLKHPHYGYIGAITGKLQWGTSIAENLERELMEEIGVVPTKYSLIGLHKEIFKNEKGEVVGDGAFFVIVVTEWEGEPRLKSIEGEYFWHDIDDILNLEKIFRGGFEYGLPRLQQYLASPETATSYIFENSEDRLAY